MNLFWQSDNVKGKWFIPQQIQAWTELLGVLMRLRHQNDIMPKNHDELSGAGFLIRAFYTFKSN